jgi:hypothetical protein
LIPERRVTTFVISFSRKAVSSISYENIRAGDEKGISSKSNLLEISASFLRENSHRSRNLFLKLFLE